MYYASPKTWCNVWKLEVHYLIHNNLWLVPVMKKKNLPYTLLYLSFKICFNIILPLIHRPHKCDYTLL